MRIIFGVAILLVCMAAWYTRRSPDSWRRATKAGRINKTVKVLFWIFGILAALWMEIAARYLSSPAPSPQLGRTVESRGIENEIVYVSPSTHTILLVLWITAIVVLVCWFFLSIFVKTDGDA
jgi:hypothetical protein